MFKLALGESLPIFFCSTCNKRSVPPLLPLSTLSTPLQLSVFDLLSLTTFLFPEKKSFAVACRSQKEEEKSERRMMRARERSPLLLLVEGMIN